MYILYLYTSIHLENVCSSFPIFCAASICDVTKSDIFVYTKMSCCSLMAFTLIWLMIHSINRPKKNHWNPFNYGVCEVQEAYKLHLKRKQIVPHAPLRSPSKILDSVTNQKRFLIYAAKLQVISGAQELCFSLNPIMICDNPITVRWLPQCTHIEHVPHRAIHEY